MIIRPCSPVPTGGSAAGVVRRTAAPARRPSRIRAHRPGLTRARPTPAPGQGSAGRIGRAVGRWVSRPPRNVEPDHLDSRQGVDQGLATPRRPAPRPQHNTSGVPPPEPGPPGNADPLPADGHVADGGPDRRRGPALGGPHRCATTVDDSGQRSPVKDGPEIVSTSRIGIDQRARDSGTPTCLIRPRR